MKSCSVRSDGAIFCIGSKGQVAGFVCCGPAQGDPSFTIYRKDSDPGLHKNNGNGHSPRPRPTPIPKPGKVGPRKNWDPRAKQLAEDLAEDWKVKLAEALRLPRCVLDALPLLGLSKNDRDGPCWTFPEVDGQGQVVGIMRRYQDGEQKALYGSNRGLTVPLRWQERDGPVYIVEGASDVLALTAIGLAAIGRPSASAGIDDLVQLLAVTGDKVSAQHSEDPVSRRQKTGLDQSTLDSAESGLEPSGIGSQNGQAARTGRPIVVLAEVDFKANGTWPGLDGAKKVASQLTARLGRPVEWAFMPDRAKDALVWFQAQNPVLNLADELQALGNRFTASVRSNRCEEGGNTPVENTAQGLALVKASDVLDDVFEWMVPNRVPQGRLCMISGEGGKGKSLITLHAAAMVTRGLPWFGLDYQAPPPGDVIIANCEDGIADTLKPRLRAAGADLDRVFFISTRFDTKGKPIPFDLTQMEELRATLDQLPEARLVVIDPVTGYFGRSGVSGNNDAELRGLLDPLQEVAIAKDVTIIPLGHFNKSVAATAKQRIAGSAGYRNVTRALWVVLDNPKKQKEMILGCDKLNNDEMPASLVYGIVQSPPQEWPALQVGMEEWPEERRMKHGKQLVRVEWRGEIDLRPDDICDGEATEATVIPGELAQAREWLQDFLADGPKPAKDCMDAGNNACQLARNDKWWRIKVLQGLLRGHVEREKCEKPRSFWCLEMQTIQTIQPGLSEKRCLFPDNPDNPDNPGVVALSE